MILEYSEKADFTLSNNIFIFFLTFQNNVCKWELPKHKCMSDIMSEVFICLPDKRNQQPIIFAFKKQYLLDLTQNNDSFVDFLREGAILSGGWTDSQCDRYGGHDELQKAHKWHGAQSQEEARPVEHWRLGGQSGFPGVTDLEGNPGNTPANGKHKGLDNTGVCLTFC